MFLHGLILFLTQKITGRELKYTALIGKPSEITYHHADYLLHQQAKQLGIDGIQTIYCIGWAYHSVFLLSAFFYQLQLCMRRTPSIFGCAKSSDVTTNFIYINTMSNVMVKAKKIFLSAKLVLGGKMFGKGDNSLKWQKHLHGEIFMQWCIMIFVKGSLSSNASKVCQTVFETSLHCCLQFTTSTRNFSSAEWHLKTVTIMAILWPLLPKNTWPRWITWSMKTHEWQKMT